MELVAVRILPVYGREHDGTGLLYYRGTLLLPVIQRFISEDPVGFAGGDPNLYAYVATVQPIKRIHWGYMPEWRVPCRGTWVQALLSKLARIIAPVHGPRGGLGNSSVDYGAGGGLF